MSKTKPNNFHIGVNGEEIASNLLKQLGYRIIKQRYLTKLGEIDIVATKGSMISFVEVKTRISHEQCLFALSKRQQYRIYHAGEYFLQQYPDYIGYDVSLDLIGINHQGKAIHFANAWH
ncbi:MAG: YraN family protein [Pseudomonadota bacterium]